MKDLKVFITGGFNACSSRCYPVQAGELWALAQMSSAQSSHTSRHRTLTNLTEQCGLSRVRGVCTWVCLANYRSCTYPTI